MMFALQVELKKMLEKYPKVKVSIAHMGGFQFSELIGTNVYVNLSAILTDLVDRYGIEKTNEIIRSFGIDKVIFASDYPDNRALKADDIYDRYFEILDQMDFDQEEMEKICRDNALKLFGL